MNFESLPALNASLNAVAATLLLVGRWAIARGRESLHRGIMLSAIGVSTVFLGSYLFYHWHHGSTPFPGEGWSRPLYFGILIPHTILAAALVPLLILTVRHALRGDFVRHHRIARFTWPIWLYVSITGVLVYFMLYQWYPTP